MTNAQSKHASMTWKEGGQSGGDFHCWVVGKGGEIIDPVFSQYKHICSIRNLDINKPKYQEWDNQEKYMEKYKINHNRQALLGSKKIWHHWFMKGPVFNGCQMNSLVECIARNSTDLGGTPGYWKVVIGSMGWKYKGSADIHWEFG